MTAHVFKFEDWFMNKNEDWDADFLFLVVDGEEIKLLNGNSEFDTNRMMETFPDRVDHECISRHRGKLEANSVLDKLKVDHPEIWDRLNRWCEIHDRRVRG